MEKSHRGSFLKAGNLFFNVLIIEEKKSHKLTKSNIFLKKATKKMSHFLKSPWFQAPWWVRGRGPPARGSAEDGAVRMDQLERSIPYRRLLSFRLNSSWEGKMGEGGMCSCWILGLISAIFARQWSASGSRTRQHPPSSPPPSWESPKSSTAWIQPFPALCIDWKIFILYIFLFNGC